MYVLSCKEVNCNKCGTCERLINGFKTQYKGYLFVSKSRYNKEEEIRCACQSLIDACPYEAIQLVSV